MDKRLAKRVGFDQSLNSTIIAADGTWALETRVEDISDKGAKLHIFSAINPRMKTDEFFLVMTRNGTVKRRSKLVWEKAGRIGVTFVHSA